MTCFVDVRRAFEMANVMHHIQETLVVVHIDISISSSFSIHILIIVHLTVVPFSLFLIPIELISFIRIQALHQSSLVLLDSLEADVIRCGFVVVFDVRILETSEEFDQVQGGRLVPSVRGLASTFCQLDRPKTDGEYHVVVDMAIWLGLNSQCTCLR